MTDFPFDVVGFDLDGTLLDTSGDIGAALNHTLARLGRPLVPSHEVPSLIGGGIGQTLNSALARGAPLPEDELAAAHAELLTYYEAHIAVHTVLYPGGLAMMDALAARGVKLAVATNKREHLAVRVFTELGLIDRFAAVIGGDTLGLERAKPKPDMIQEMIARSGGGKAAFVGDTTFDVGAARAAGIPVVAVSFGFNDLSPHDLGADMVIDHFDELIPALAKLG